MLNRRRKIIRVAACIALAAVLTVGAACCSGISKSAVPENSAGSASENTYESWNDVSIIEDTVDAGVGTVAMGTLPLDKLIGDNQCRHASYSASGRVVFSYTDKSTDDNEWVFAVCDDDGSNYKEIYRGGGFDDHILPFADNRRVLLGSMILEVPEGSTLDDCEPLSGRLLYLEYPEEMSSDEAVYKTWSEVIISPDNEHVAWTILRTDCGAVDAIGKLERVSSDTDYYTITDAQYISRSNSFVEDPDNEGYLLAQDIVGGEVKQFVHGGAAISVVGADTNGDANSVIVDYATGTSTQVMHNPGYDETTIFSPNEKYGIVMTSRFSEETNLAVLGLLPRPYGNCLMNIMSQIYMYDVTGVRGAREGNVGPALINIEQSESAETYTGIDLSDPNGEYVYRSPMSWSSDSTKAMWIEGSETGKFRVRIVELLDAEPQEGVAVADAPEVGDYADDEIVINSLDGKVAGAVSGYMELTHYTGEYGSGIRMEYVDYSDDGETYYNGTESSEGTILTDTLYTADLIVTNVDGAQLGAMNVRLHFTPGYGDAKPVDGPAPQIVLDDSYGTASWGDRTADMSRLVQ